MSCSEFWQLVRIVVSWNNTQYCCSPQKLSLRTLNLAQKSRCVLSSWAIYLFILFLRCLVSVLHLGNVYFHRKQLKHGQEAVEIGSKKEIKWAAHLLQIDSDGIIRALTTKSTVSGLLVIPSSCNFRFCCCVNNLNTIHSQFNIFFFGMHIQWCCNFNGGNTN